MHPFSPSGKFTNVDFIALLVTMCIAGIAVGALACFVGNYMRLVLFFPLAIGGLMGLVAMGAIRWRHIQAPVFAALVVGLGGAVAWTADYWFQYRQDHAYVREMFRQIIQMELQDLEPIELDELHELADSGDYAVIHKLADTLEDVAFDEGDEERVASMPPDEADDLFDDEYVDISEPRDLDQVVNSMFVSINRGMPGEEFPLWATVFDVTYETDDGELVEPAPPATTRAAFLAWMDTERKAGTTISRASDFSGEGANIGSIGTTLLWIVEFLLVVGVAATLAHRSAGQPYCTRCKKWYQDFGEVVPLTKAENAELVLEALALQDADVLEPILFVDAPSKPFVGMRLRDCAGCSRSPAFAEIVHVQDGKKGEERQVLCKGLLEPELVQGILAMQPSGREEQEDAPQSAVS